LPERLGSGPVDRASVRAWIDAYERAWRTAGVAGLAELFSADAVYSPGPFEEAVNGLAAIEEMWERERQGPDEAFKMKSELIAVEGDTAVARLEVHYGEPRSQLYLDLWVMRFDEAGRCSAFEEWPFWPPGTNGIVAGTGPT
jgi:ketosteroid isomerase-like protein